MHATQCAQGKTAEQCVLYPTGNSDGICCAGLKTLLPQNEPGLPAAERGGLIVQGRQWDRFNW